MSAEARVKEIFQEVLDIKQSEIVPGAKLDESLGIDSTEMVQISVTIKKQLGIELKDNELKKSHSFNEIVGIINSKMQPTSSASGDGCGCGHKH